MLKFRFPYFTCSERESSGCTAVSSLASRLSAVASSTVRLTRTSLARPPMNDCPGYTVSRFAPIAWMRASMARWAPVPSFTTAITAPTPMMMPSMVRPARSLLDRMLENATQIVSPIIMAVISSGRARAPAARGRWLGRAGGPVGDVDVMPGTAPPPVIWFIRFRASVCCCTGLALGSTSTESCARARSPPRCSRGR